MTKAQKAEQEEARQKLREWLKPGDTVYTIIRHCSRSGMSRTIQCISIEKGEPAWLGYSVALATGHPYDRKNEGVRIGGCGMDMGFALVYDLSSYLYPDGFDCIGEGCPSNDHSNRENNTHHKDGGYALKQRWL